MAVIVVPAAVMPMPMTVPSAMPVAVVVPAHFFRLDVIDVVLRYDSAFSVNRRRSALQISRHRRQRCGLRASGKRGASGHKAYR